MRLLNCLFVGAVLTMVVAGPARAQNTVTL